MDKVPTGWVKHGSGVLVPVSKRRIRRAPAVVVIALAFALSSPAAGAVSAWSRAAMDVLTMLRSAFTDNPTRSGDYSSCEPRRP